MALHPRLQQPTLEEPPVRRGHGFIVAMALTVLAAGFAYAMPKAMNTSATADPTDAVVLSDEDLVPGSTATPTATPSPTPTHTDEPDDSDEDDSDEDDGDGENRTENHGAAVSTAARCDLAGRAHGEFVRSIAHDKDATVAEVEVACEAAKAAADADATDEEAKPARGHGKPDKAGFDDVEVADESESAGTVPDDADSDDDEAESGGDKGPPDHAGNKNKP